jgi:predicted kinase
MPTYYMFRGLPASGKSTQARQLLEEHPKSLLVSRDNLRFAILNNIWSGKKESAIYNVCKQIRLEAARLHYNIIDDNTNLGDKKVEEIKGFCQKNGYAFKIIDVPTPVEECIKRDSGRTGYAKVGKDVILNMAHQHGIVKQERTWVGFDLDGTLADISERLKLSTKSIRPDGKRDMNWKTFFDPDNVKTDQPRQEIFEHLRREAQEHEIVILSGRCQTTRFVTEGWLDGWFSQYSIPISTKDIRIIMRPTEDTRSDVILKKEYLDKYVDKAKCVRIYDDRPCVIRMWRENGIEVVDCGDGTEF